MSNREFVIKLNKKKIQKRLLQKKQQYVQAQSTDCWDECCNCCSVPCCGGLLPDIITFSWTYNGVAYSVEVPWVPIDNEYRLDNIPPVKLVDLENWGVVEIIQVIIYPCNFNNNWHIEITAPQFSDFPAPYDYFVTLPGTKCILPFSFDGRTGYDYTVS